MYTKQQDKTTPGAQPAVKCTLPNGCRTHGKFSGRRTRCVCCVCVCVCYNVFQMCAPGHLDSTGCTVCVKHSPLWWWDGKISHVSHESRLYGIHASELPTNRQRTVRIWNTQSGGQRGKVGWIEIYLNLQNDLFSQWPTSRSSPHTPHTSWHTWHIHLSNIWLPEHKSVKTSTTTLRLKTRFLSKPPRGTVQK